MLFTQAMWTRRAGNVLMVFRSGRITQNTKASGLTTKPMVKDSCGAPTETSTRVTGRMTRLMDSEDLYLIKVASNT